MIYRIFLLISVITCLISCNNVPNKSIFKPLSSDDLSPIIKNEPRFAEFYEELQDEIKSFNEIERAKFNDITYRSLYKVIQFMNDTTKIAPLARQWSTEWEEEFGGYESKIDSVVNYWTDYKIANSLDRFVKVEFAVIDKEYYSYSRDVKDVNLGFRLTPIQGTIEQIKFNYRYSAKIDDFYGDKHRCISTTPFNTPVIRYWGVEYSDEKRLKNVSTTEFIRDFNINIEITDVRIGGVNYSTDDLDIPSSIERLLNTDQGKYPNLYNLYRENIIADILCSSYKSRYLYISEKLSELMREKFPRDYAFIEYTESADKD